MKEKAILGIIGCGAMAKGTHLGNAFSNPRVYVKWCCDINRDNLDYVRKNYAPEMLTEDYNDILNDPEVDGVLILTTHDIRERIISDAADAKKHIYVEKPMSMSPGESYRIMRAVRKNSVKLVVGFNRRLAPIVQDAVEIYRSHKANPAQADTAWRLKRVEGAWKPLPEEDATMILMRINDDVVSYKPYAIDEMIGQGAIKGEMCHFVDLACYILGKEPVKVYAEGWARINQIITLQFEDKSMCCIFSSAGGSFDHPKELIEIYHKGASIVLDHYLQLRVGGIKGTYKKDYPFTDDPYPHINEGEGCNLFINKVKERNRVAQELGSNETAYAAADKGHYNLLEGFVDCILAGADSPCNELDGARATLITSKAIESVRLGLPIKISCDEYNYFMS